MGIIKKKHSKDLADNEFIIDECDCSCSNDEGICPCLEDVNISCECENCICNMEMGQDFVEDDAEYIEQIDEKTDKRLRRKELKEQKRKEKKERKNKKRNRNNEEYYHDDAEQFDEIIDDLNTTEETYNSEEAMTSNNDSELFFDINDTVDDNQETPFKFVNDDIRNNTSKNYGESNFGNSTSYNNDEHSRSVVNDGYTRSVVNDGYNRTVVNDGYKPESTLENDLRDLANKIANKKVDLALKKSNLDKTKDSNEINSIRGEITLLESDIKALEDKYQELLNKNNIEDIKEDKNISSNDKFDDSVFEKETVVYQESKNTSYQNYNIETPLHVENTSFESNRQDYFNDEIPTPKQTNEYEFKNEETNLYSDNLSSYMNFSFKNRPRIIYSKIELCNRLNNSINVSDEEYDLLTVSAYKKIEFLNDVIRNYRPDSLVYDLEFLNKSLKDVESALDVFLRNNKK